MANDYLANPFDLADLSARAVEAERYLRRRLEPKLIGNVRGVGYRIARID